MRFNELKAAVDGSHTGSVRVIFELVGCALDAGGAQCRMGGDGDIGIEWDSQPGYCLGADKTLTVSASPRMRPAAPGTTARGSPDRAPSLTEQSDGRTGRPVMRCGALRPVAGRNPRRRARWHTSAGRQSRRRVVDAGTPHMTERTDARPTAARTDCQPLAPRRAPSSAPGRAFRTVGSEIPYVTPGGRRAGTMRVVEVRGGRPQHRRRSAGFATCGRCSERDGDSEAPSP